jgi:hypothetical protein
MQNIFMSVITLTLLLSPLAFAKNGNSGGNNVGSKGSSSVMQKSGSQYQNKNQNQYKYQHKNQGQSQQNQYQQQSKDKNYYDYGISEKKSGK